MNVLALLGHIGLLIHMEKDIQGIVQNLVNHKENFPSSVEFIELLDDAISVLQSGILALPDEIVNTMTASIEGVKKALQPEVKPQ